MQIEDGQFEFSPRERMIFGDECKAINRSLAAEIEYRKLFSDREPDGSPAVTRLEREAVEKRIAALFLRGDDLRRRAALPQYSHIGRTHPEAGKVSVEMTEEQFALVLRTLDRAHSNTRIVPRQEDYRELQGIIRRMREQIDDGGVLKIGARVMVVGNGASFRHQFGTVVAVSTEGRPQDMDLVGVKLDNGAEVTYGAAHLAVVRNR